MAAQSKKVRKEQRRRNRKRHAMARSKRRKSRAADHPPDEIRFDSPEPLSDSDYPELCDTLDDEDKSLDDVDDVDVEPPELSQREEAAVELWWNKYLAADGAARLKMTRQKLETVSADDDWYRHLFPEAVSELQTKLPTHEYVNFLEEIYDARHDVFSMSADWNTRSMVFEYLAQDRLDDVDRVCMTLATELKEVSDPFFSLVSTIRLAGRADTVQALIDAASRQLKASGLMYWAVDEVLEWAMFPHYQRCIAAGATDDAIDGLHAAASDLGIEDAKRSQEDRRDVALHLSGQAKKQWCRSELTTGNRKAVRKVYLLTFDYQRWLCEARDFQPVVADELRRMVIGAIDGMRRPFKELLNGLPRREFDAYLARKLGFMSLDRIHAPATIVAMKHYYDFLKELELVKQGSWQNSQFVCDALWAELRDGFQDERRRYHFLEQYVTG